MVNKTQEEIQLIKEKVRDDIKNKICINPNCNNPKGQTYICKECFNSESYDDVKLPLLVVLHNLNSEKITLTEDVEGEVDSDVILITDKKEEERVRWVHARDKKDVLIDSWLLLCDMDEMLYCERLLTLNNPYNHNTPEKKDIDEDLGSYSMTGEIPTLVYRALVSHLGLADKHTINKSDC